MTYWQFHVAFLLSALAALLGWQHWRSHPAPRPVWRGIALAAVIALVYTTPWDNYLVWRGVWSYRPERVLASWRIGYVPLEEYLFFVLQPVLTGLCLWSFGQARLFGRQVDCPPGHPWQFRRAGAIVAAASGVAGALALAAGGKWLYVGLILIWSAPPATLHWLYGGDVLWKCRRVALPALTLATVYLWIADRVAIAVGIWSISTQHSTGWALFGLPVEEALFFAVTNLLIIQTLLLLWHRIGRTRAPGLPLP